jgi:raffinose/stachyose/melibiose transport system permease protein
MAITEQLRLTSSLPSVKKRRRKDAFAWLALAPSMLWSTAFLIFPLGLVVWYSFTDWSGFNTPQFQGLANYKQLAGPDFGNALRVTAIFAIGGAVATIGIAFGLSVLIQQRLRGWRFYRVLWFTPSLIPGAVIALLWVSGAYYPTKGLADTIIRAVGFTPPAEGWLDTPNYALVALMLTAIWATTGFPMLLLSAAMERIPAEIAEAGRIDGAAHHVPPDTSDRGHGLCFTSDRLDEDVRPDLHYDLRGAGHIYDDVGVPHVQRSVHWQ